MIARVAKATRAPNTSIMRGTRIMLSVFLLPCAPPSSAGGAGDFDEHCSSSAARRGVCALPGRVAQSPVLPSNAGDAEGTAHRGVFFFPPFSFGQAKEMGRRRGRSPRFCFMPVFTRKGYAGGSPLLRSDPSAGSARTGWIILREKSKPAIVAPMHFSRHISQSHSTFSLLAALKLRFAR